VENRLELKGLQIVSLDKIPGKEAIANTPTNDLIILYATALQMMKICGENDGVGLAAAQLGIPWKMFVAESDSGYDCFVNCEYEPANVPFPKQTSIEGCLSIRDSAGNILRFRVPRWPQVRVFGKQLKIEESRPVLVDVDMLVEGKRAVLFQHEIDHGFGILISDIGTPVQLW
jgi:peptide deformylase